MCLGCHGDTLNTEESASSSTATFMAPTYLLLKQFQIITAISLTWGTEPYIQRILISYLVLTSSANLIRNH